MSTGAFPTGQALPAQPLHHAGIQPQTPHLHSPQGVQPALQVQTPAQLNAIPPAQLQGQAYAHVQNILKQRALLQQRQQAMYNAANLAMPPAARPFPFPGSQPTPALVGGQQQYVSPRPVMYPAVPNRVGPSMQQAQHQMYPGVIPEQQAPRVSINHAPSGTGPGKPVLRLLQFAEQISPGEQVTDLSFWKAFASEFFTTAGVLKITLRNAETGAHESYDILSCVVGRYFYTLYDSSVVSLQMSLSQASESFLNDGSARVFSPRASFIYRFENGSMVVSTGTLSSVLRRMPDDLYRIDVLDFECQKHEEFIDRKKLEEFLSLSKAKQSKQEGKDIIESPVNEYGIPPRMYQWLKIADNMARLSDVFLCSEITGAGPKESLQILSHNGKLAEQVKVEESQPSGGGKVKAARRSSKTKEDRHKLTRRKTPAKGTKKSSVSKTPAEELLPLPVNGVNNSNNNNTASPVVGTQQLPADAPSSSSTPMYTINFEHPTLQADFQTQQQIAMQRFHQYQQQPFQQATYPGQQQQQQQQYVLPQTQQ